MLSFGVILKMSCIRSIRTVTTTVLCSGGGRRQFAPSAFLLGHAGGGISTGPIRDSVGRCLRTPASAAKPLFVFRPSEGSCGVGGSRGEGPRPPWPPEAESPLALALILDA